MFDLTSSKLLILGLVALIVVGPKDLPMLLRTVGKYLGIIKRQAAEFRSQFDEAMRDAELQQLKKDVESLGQDTEKALREGEQALQNEVGSVKQEMEGALNAASAPATNGIVADPLAHDANGIAIATASVSEPGSATSSPAVLAAAAAAGKPGA